jgi:hypothetical protein
MIYTTIEYNVFIWWESGIWWRLHGAICVMLDDYRSPYQA